MADIRHLVEIKAPIRTIYKAITEEEGLKSWWTPDTIAVPEEGAILEFKFADRYHDKMRVIRLRKDSMVEWECIQGDEEWVGTKFVFELEEKGETTVLRFNHCDWRVATDFFASCNYNWGYYMRSLKSYCETGEGTPFKS